MMSEEEDKCTVEDKPMFNKEQIGKPIKRKYDEDTSDKNCLRCGRFLKKSEIIDGLCESCYKKMAKRE